MARSSSSRIGFRVVVVKRNRPRLGFEATSEAGDSVVDCSLVSLLTVLVVVFADWVLKRFLKRLILVVTSGADASVTGEAVAGDAVAGEVEVTILNRLNRVVTSTGASVLARNRFGRNGFLE